jgi:hypothetical protein
MFDLNYFNKKVTKVAINYHWLGYWNTSLPWAQRKHEGGFWMPDEEPWMLEHNAIAGPSFPL